MRADAMPNLILSEFVEPELTAIWEHIAFDNRDAAGRFLESAYRTFLELAQMPELGRPRRFSHARLHKLRSFRIRDFENYLVFYAPVADGIEVYHVLHGARDLEAFFEKD